MEHSEELQSINKSTMADKLNESTKDDPEMWYKIVRNIEAEGVVESSSHSEDELDLSHGRDPCKSI